jgi:hypothetical protein
LESKKFLITSIVLSKFILLLSTGKFSQNSRLEIPACKRGLSNSILMGKTFINGRKLALEIILVIILWLMQERPAMTRCHDVYGY